MADPVEEFRAWLDSLGRGPIALDLQPTFARLLAAAWGALEGHEKTSMSSHKLTQERIEKPAWDAPLVRFVIERHPQTVHGSSRANVQTWIVDLDALTARVDAERVRQVRPMQKRVKCDDLAVELSGLILKKTNDARFTWSKDFQSVALNMREIIPVASSKQTSDERRRRLRTALVQILSEHGWTSPTTNKFQAPVRS